MPETESHLSHVDGGAATGASHHSPQTDASGRWTGTSVRRLAHVASGIAVLVATSVVAAPAAHADPSETFARAYAATRDVASTTGLDIIVVSKSNRARDLGNRIKGISAGASVRMHYEVNPQKDEYTSYRLVKGKKLLGAWGRNPAQGKWATLSSFYGTWPNEFARSRGLSLTTAITQLDERMPTLSLLEGNTGRALSALVSNSANSASADEIGWNRGGVSETVEPDGTIIISVKKGAGNREGGDDCTYGPLTYVIQGGLLRSAKWKRSCPDGEVSMHTGSVEYEAQVDGATGPSVTENQAFALPDPPRSVAWRALADAANRTVSTPFASISIVNQRGMNIPNANAVNGLEFLTELMLAGNVGMPQAMGGAGPGDSAYLINANRGQEYLLKIRNYEIDSLMVNVGADGLIRSITTVIGDPRDQFVSTFTR